MTEGAKRILVVDDDEMAAASIRATLAAHGYNVTLMTSGADALSWLSREAPDLVILDVVMPGLSGFDVCRKMRESERLNRTPVIFLTARNRLKDLLEGKAAGSDLYLVKPILATRLINMVDMFLGRDAPLDRSAGAAPPPSAAR
jgi:DNA-binding response OmpR family regulator